MTTEVAIVILSQQQTSFKQLHLLGVELKLAGNSCFVKLLKIP